MLFAFLQVDGGKTFTEPCVIYCGDVRGREDVSCLQSDRVFVLVLAYTCERSRA